MRLRKYINYVLNSGVKKTIYNFYGFCGGIVSDLAKEFYKLCWLWAKKLPSVSFAGSYNLLRSYPMSTPHRKLPSACRTPSRGGQNLTLGLFTASNYGHETSKAELPSERL